MAGQLLPLRILTSSKILRGTFAFRLKTLTFSSNPSLSLSSVKVSSGRSFSSRAPRPRDGGRSGFRSGRAAAGGGQGKSLIEDEAELSDWVSDLKTDSFKLGLSGSDNEEADRDRRRSGRTNERDDGVRGRDSGGFSSRRGSKGSVGFSERNSGGSMSRRRFDSNFDGGDRRGSRGSNGLRNNQSSEGFSERKTRGSQPKRRFVSDLEDEVEEEEEKEKELFLSRQSRGRGSSSSFSKRGGINTESSYKQGRKSISAMSEEEDEDDDDDVDGLDDDFFGDKVDGKKLGMKDSFLKSDSSAELGNEDSVKPVSRSSGGDQDSYLSNTR